MKTERIKRMVGLGISSVASLGVVIAPGFGGSGIRLDSASASMAHPITNFLAFHTGDGAVAWDFYWVPYLLSHLAFPNISEKKRIVASAAITSIPLIALETITFPQHALGWPDLVDIPFGLFGIAAAVGFLSSMKYTLKAINNP